ncbi:Stp1/IreP family PP2C-type Ser/Thr phosphatase [Parachitinimonas caeni]|uniref:Stp1/IreP family PP2C-type Ser/Thr phosphatase n=1 Tax=Parachitinimonas caeni TaxID=3031301 RepID=A0ABT7DT15_9NEIS|nr:Stp1/IreP family PP2C-type Ser/Thr phosphatase [Parachitinimonas caeni]MDK2123214.1 Stp1/IreP family PP2C-type Ser/Thr phosphatase [Parachitinimonas caeni]
MGTLVHAIEMQGISDSGMVRGHNEDAIGYKPELGLAILADGMGGYNAGEVASGIAVTLISEGVKGALESMAPHRPEPMSGKPLAHRILRDEIEKANLAIFQTAQSQPQCAGMGTTLVAALFYDNRLTIAHVGDSRVYRLRGENFTVLTKDHSLLQEQIDSGFITPEQARQSQNKNLVTRAVGIDPQLNPELNDHEVQVNDIYLICSDGLNDMVPDEDIALVMTTLRSNLQLASQQLIQMANDNGGRDNVSVILIKVKHDYAAERSLWARLFSWFAR